MSDNTAALKALFCVECRKDVEIGEKVVPIAVHDGTPEITIKWAIHLDCLVTRGEAKEISRREAQSASDPRLHQGPYGYGARPW